MSLTVPQLQAIKAWVIANNSSLFDQSSVNLLNAAASPAYSVWRTNLGKHELQEEPSVDVNGTTPTSFVWGGATGGYINRSQGERDAYRELFNSVLACKPSLANVRTAFTDIFSGAGAGAVANRAHCWGSGQRAATVCEKLLAIPTVGGPTQTGSRGARTNPDTLTLDGQITLQDVINSESVQGN